MNQEKNICTENTNKIVFTHADFDGVCCAILLSKIFSDIEVIPNTYSNINTNFLKYIHYSKKKYSHIFLTDVSLNEDDYIKELVKINNSDITFIDHHPIKYDFKFKNQLHDIRNSGCLLTLKYLTSKFNFEFSKELKTLVLYGDDYDMWRHRYAMSKAINRLFYYYGFNKFLKRFKNGFNGLSQEEIEFLRKNNEYVKKTLRETEYIKITDNIVFVTSSELIDEFAEYYHKNLKGVDTVFVLNPKSNSLSIRGKNDKIHHGEFAEKFGGGGHKKASGIKITGEKHIENIIDTFIKYYEVANSC